MTCLKCGKVVFIARVGCSKEICDVKEIPFVMVCRDYTFKKINGYMIHKCPKKNSIKKCN